MKRFFIPKITLWRNNAYCDSIIFKVKLSLYFLAFLISHSIVQSYMYWFTKNTESLSVLHFKFSSLWALWLFSLLIATPLLSLANLGFGVSFYYGFRDYNNSAWLILLTYVAAQTVAVPIIIYLWFQEIPQKGPLLGAILCLIGILIANLWKD
ncbi:MAG: hypothetical protein HYW47_06240 [Deltaproteobacteria bacterium]|nr:hypothetical protein [Deltaproteobacteria bacterium]